MDVDIQNQTISELKHLLDSGQLSVRELADSCLERIAAVDDRINAVIELNPDALSIAEQCDVERQASMVTGALHGIPILIKDNIDTADAMMTTAGSLALDGSIAGQDAGIVKKLRDAGAVILGKTNLSEWANMRSPKSCTGWSSRGGQTRNPYVLDRSPGGSSAGSGAAVAAGYCPVAIGTETDGSIIYPAAQNSLVGIKPTLGLVSRSGIIPISHSQDTAGPLARCVADAAMVLGAIAGSDPRDPACNEADQRRAPDYTAFLDADGLKGARVGLFVPEGRYHDGIPAIMDEALRVMGDGGAKVIEGVSLPSIKDVTEYEHLVLLTDFKVDLNAYLSGLSDEIAVRSLSDVIRFNEDHSDTVMRWFGQEAMEAAELTSGLDAPAYIEAREKCLKLTRTEGIDKAMDEYGLDAIVTMSADVPCLIDLENGDADSGMTTHLAAVSGYPSISVPAGYVGDLPVGISFIAKAWAEPQLIRMAYAFEQAANVRRVPELLETSKV